MEGLRGIALVTDASRGVGRGVAIALGAAGYRVYATGRAILDADLSPGLIRLKCDHASDQQTAAVFSRIAIESGKLDVLVHSTRPEADAEPAGADLSFWSHGVPRGDPSMHASGARSASITAQHAARLMVRSGSGLIVNLAYWSAVKYAGNAIYGTADAEANRTTTETALDLRPYGVAVVTLYPGLVRTEAALESSDFDFANSESPEFTGRVIAALASDPKLKRRSGEAFVVADLAIEYGVVDIDGKQPAPILLEEP